jgi:hypothetical protein
MSGAIRPVAGITSERTRRVSGDREKNDFYRTPPKAIDSLLDREPLPEAVWEPACGDGAISERLAARGHSVVSTDLFDRGYGRSRIDFLMERVLLAPAVVTNPPFKLAEEFASHAISLGADKICLFQRTAFLEGTARHTRLWSRHPPVRVWIFSWRVTLWRGDQVGRETGGVMSLAWFIWERGFRGHPELRWIA